MFCGSITHVAGATCVMKVIHFKKQKNKKKALFNEQDFDLERAAPVLDSPLFMFCGSITHVAPATCVMKVFHFKKQKNKKKALFNEQDFDLERAAPVLNSPLFMFCGSSSYVCDESISF